MQLLWISVKHKLRLGRDLKRLRRAFYEVQPMVGGCEAAPSKRAVPVGTALLLDAGLYGSEVTRARSASS
jgi:hypothetical protein